MVLVATLAALALLHIYIVRGGSMEPTYHEGERLLVEGLSYHLGVARGEIIVFHNPHTPAQTDIKRVIGLPGETVMIKGGQLSVRHTDGAIETYAATSRIGRGGNGSDLSMQLGPYDYFVLGDNRSQSTDSRAWGAVQPSDIIGKVLWTL